MIQTVDISGLLCCIKFRSRPSTIIREELKRDGFQYYYPTAEWRGRAQYYQKYRAIQAEELQKKNSEHSKKLPPTLCGNCYHADKGDNSNCPWAREFKPVDGWDAIPTKILAYTCNYRGEQKAYYTPSFCVRNCPMFKRG